MEIETTAWREAPIDLPEGRIEAAIGDVHGLAGHLEALLAALAAATAGRASLTLLGDLVDRGPRGLAALRRATGTAAGLGVSERHLLLGNHEIMMLDALSPSDASEGERRDRCAAWVGNGGDRILDEAGTTVRDLIDRPDAAARAVRDAVGPGWAVLEAAPLWRRSGGLVFVHAGVDPSVPLDRFLGRAARRAVAVEHHPAWIRWPFLRHEEPFEDGVVVVHGHTPEFRVLARKGRDAVPGRHALDGARLGLDGGSTVTGIVAAAEFRRGRYRVLLARG